MVVVVVVWETVAVVSAESDLSTLSVSRVGHVCFYRVSTL